MKNNRLRNSIANLFLILFIAMKMVGLHALLHTDDEDHDVECTSCDHAIICTIIPLLTPNSEDFFIRNIEYSIPYVRTTYYHFMISNAIASDQLFSRPPPFLL